MFKIDGGYTEQIEGLQDQNRELLVENTILNEELKTQNEKLTSENEKLTSENEKLTSENEKLKTELNDLKEHIKIENVERLQEFLDAEWKAMSAMGESAALDEIEKMFSKELSRLQNLEQWNSFPFVRKMD